MTSANNPTSFRDGSVKRIFFFLILLICCSSVYSYDISYFKEIRNVSLSLKGDDDNQTVLNIRIWTSDNINYIPHWYPQSLRKTWEEKQGDCSDTAMLQKIMLYHHGIQSRYVYGYMLNGVLHDWIEVKVDNKWYDTEKVYGHKKIGYGIW